MARWELSDAMGKRIVKRLHDERHRLGFKVLVKACEEEDAARPWSMAEDWLRWARHQDTAVFLAAIIAVDLMSAYRDLRGNVRDFKRGMVGMFWAADCTPWVEPDDE